MNFTSATRSEYQFVGQIRIPRPYLTGKSGKHFEIHYGKSKLKLRREFLVSGSEMFL